MSAIEMSEKVWERAFELAYFILVDRSRARECVARAIEKLATQRAREKRRAHWWARKAETVRRISAAAEDTLQWLIFLECERYEREQEEQGLATEAEMIVRYIKHLALLTIASSFHVHVGFNQLLRKYSTHEAQQVYELATGRYPGSEEYPKARGRLFKQLARRFGSFLTVQSAPPDGLQFRALEQPEHWSALIDQCLGFFTPWSAHGSCLPRGGQGGTGVAEAFRQGDNGHVTRLEASRCHWFMHSTCYRQFVRHFGFDPPEERLAVPRFRHQSDSYRQLDPGSAERRTDALSEADIKALRQRVHSLSGRPRQIAPGPLKIIAHDVVCARLDAGADELRQFDVAESIRLLEVWSDTDGRDEILAIHWMDRGEDAGFAAGDYTIALKGGRQLTLSVTPLPEADDGGHWAFVTIESHSMATLGDRFRSLTPFFGRANSRWHLALAAVTLIVVGAFASAVYVSPGISTDGLISSRIETAIADQNATIAALATDISVAPKLVTRFALSSTVPNFRGPGDSGEPVVRFAPGEPLVILEVPVPGDARGSYRAIVSSFPQEQERLSETALQPVMRDHGWVVEFALPVSSVEGGARYVLTLTRSSGADGARYTFVVQRE